MAFAEKWTVGPECAGRGTCVEAEARETALQRRELLRQMEAATPIAARAKMITAAISATNRTIFISSPPLFRPCGR
jgi:hypothetical protein